MSNFLATLGQQQEIIAGVGIQSENNYSFVGNQGAVGSYTLFTVTGVVAVKIVGVVTATVTSAGAPAIEVGTTINTAALIPQVVDGTGLAVNEIWHDATPDSSVELISGLSSFPEKLVTQDIKVKVSTAAATGGSVRFIVLWRPLSSGALLVAVNPGDRISASASVSASVSPSASTSPSSSASRSQSPSASASPSASVSPSASASRSLSPSTSLSPSASQSPSASRSPSSSASPSASASPTFAP